MHARAIHLGTSNFQSQRVLFLYGSWNRDIDRVIVGHVPGSKRTN